MHHRVPRLTRLALLPVLLLAATARAGDETAPPAPTASAESTARDGDASTRPAEPTRAVQVKSMFKNLRFEEDWSALADPEAETDHMFPGIKHIELSEDWTASFGGQVRYQAKSESNKNLKGTQPGRNSYSSVRTRLHADVRYEDALRFFVEVLHAGTYSNEYPPIGIDRQDLDLLNAFAELRGDGVRLRLGRTEMQYGAQRLVSPLDWGNTRRTFQGGVLSVDHGPWTTDVFVTRPVMVDPVHNDGPDRSRYFSGVYNTRRLEGGGTFDVYGLALNELDDIFTSGSGTTMGDMDLYTLGGRWADKSGDTDWELELARQFGQRAGDDISAYMWTARAGQTLPDCELKPRFGIDFDYASGDGNPADGDVGTFNQLFPLGHAYFGYLDLVGRQNIFAVQPNVTMQVGGGATLRVAYSDFRLVDDRDALYNAGGAVSLVDPTGSSGNHVGKEIDVTLAFTPEVTAPHGKLLLGYSTFEPRQFVEALGDGKRAHMLYLQYVFTF
jgi:hypothetical protein